MGGAHGLGWADASGLRRCVYLSAHVWGCVSLEHLKGTYGRVHSRRRGCSFIIYFRRLISAVSHPFFHCFPADISPFGRWVFGHGQQQPPHTLKPAKQALTPHDRRVVRSLRARLRTTSDTSIRSPASLAVVRANPKEPFYTLDRT